jgi:hypothetical protein
VGPPPRVPQGLRCLLIFPVRTCPDHSFPLPYPLSLSLSLSFLVPLRSSTSVQGPPPKPKPSRSYIVAGPPRPGVALCFCLLTVFPHAPKYRSKELEFTDPIFFLSHVEHEVATYDIYKVVPPYQRPSRHVEHEAAAMAPSRPQAVRCQP